MNGGSEGKKALKIPERTIKNITNTLQTLINIQLEWTQIPEGAKLVEIDIPFIKGFINVKFGLTGLSTTVAKPDEMEMVCIGHIVIKK